MAIDEQALKDLKESSIFIDRYEEFSEKLNNELSKNNLDDQIKIWNILDGFYELKESWFKENLKKYKNDAKSLIKIWGSLKGDFTQFNYKDILRKIVEKEDLSKEDAIDLFSNTEAELLSYGIVKKLLKKIDIKNAESMFTRYCNLKERYENINQILRLSTLDERVANYIGEEKLINLACNDLLQIQIQKNINNKNFMKVLGYIAQNRPNWTLELDSVCKNFEHYEKLIENIKDIELSNEQLRQLYLCLLQRKNWFKVETLEELENYEENRKEICQNILEEKDIKEHLSNEFENLNESEKKTFAILELSYGIDIESAKNLVYKYGRDIDEIINGKYSNEKVVKEIKNLKIILNLTKEDIQTLYNENKKTIQEWNNIEYSASVHIEEQAIELFEKIYSEEIKIEEKKQKSIKYKGKIVEVSEIVGDFMAFFRVEGAFNPDWYEPENFNDNLEKIDPVWKRSLQKFCLKQFFWTCKAKWPYIWIHKM